MRVGSDDTIKYMITDVAFKWIIDLVLVAVISLFIINYYGDSVEVIGNSMNPIVKNEEKVLIDELTYELKSPERFDIVAYKTRSGEISIKRIIGLPGETIQILDNTIYIDGTAIKDEYFDGKFENGYVGDSMVIGDNEYFVMGDNRNVSEDSRFEYVGNVTKENILGKVWFAYYPFTKLRLI